LFRQGANYLAVGDILGNVIVVKPTPREFFFKFCDRVLEGSSRFHHILSINVSPKSAYMLISRSDGSVFVFKEFQAVINISNMLGELELISQAKKVPKKASKSPPKTPINAEKRKTSVNGAVANLQKNVEHDDHEDAISNSVKKIELVEQTKLFQLHSTLKLRPTCDALIQCCSISDAGMSATPIDSLLVFFYSHVSQYRGWLPRGLS
jgi:hypothetical protein